jgi:hypothetical protein
VHEQRVLKEEVAKQALLEKKLAEALVKNCKKQPENISQNTCKLQGNEDEEIPFILPWKLSEKEKAVEGPKMSDAREEEGLSPEELEKLLQLDEATKHLPKIYPPTAHLSSSVS